MSRHAADGMQRNITTERVAMTDKSSKPAAKRVTARKPRTTRRRKPTHREISVRAYFLHLEDPGSSEVGNWLRAEREMTLA
jgi:hypothetical protein